MENGTMEGVVEFEVTPALIAQGKRWDGDSCPVAMAIRAKVALPEIAVGHATAEIGETFLTRKAYDLPESAAVFVWLFDNEGKDAVKPFTFKIDFAEGRLVNE